MVKISGVLLAAGICYEKSTGLFTILSINPESPVSLSEPSYKEGSFGRFGLLLTVGSNCEGLLLLFDTLIYLEEVWELVC